jgi:hypothetical protein
MTYEDPLDWDRQIQTGHQLVERYRRALHVEPAAAEDGPFVGTPFVTTRAAFDRIRELPVELPLREPLLRWAFRMADARINAELERNLARAWRTEVLRIDRPRSMQTTRAEILACVLRDAPARRIWLELLAQQLDGLTESTSLLWQRREELAQRAGFAGFSAASDPTTHLEQHIVEWRATVNSGLPRSWGKDPVELLTTALASTATQGWPARLNAQSVAALLGSRDWLRRVVREPHWPTLIGPTSFVRALHALGRELAFGWAATTHPFVVAHRAGGLSEQRLGYLLASLVTNLEWQKRALGVRPDKAREQVRALAFALLYAGHGLSLKVQLARAATRSASALEQAHTQNLIEMFGFELPRVFAGQVPKLDFDDAHALVGFWLGLSDHERLRQTHDVDWFRNPRAIEAVLEQSAAIGPDTIESTEIEQRRTAATRWLLEATQV